MQAVDLFHSDPRNPIAIWLSVRRDEEHLASPQLDQVAHNAAILDFSMLPADTPGVMSDQQSLGERSSQEKARYTGGLGGHSGTKRVERPGGVNSRCPSCPMHKCL